MEGCGKIYKVKRFVVRRHGMIEKVKGNMKALCATEGVLIFGAMLFLDCIARIGVGVFLHNVIGAGEFSLVLNWLKNAPVISFLLLSVIIAIMHFVLSNIMYDNRKVKRFFYVCFVISILVVFGHFIVGDGYYMYSDIGSDTIHQYYPFYVNEVLHIRNGDFSIYNWNFGLGTNIISANMWLMDPFGIFVVIVGCICGPGAVAYALVWMQIFKLACIYLISSKLFRYFFDSEVAVGTAALTFSFSGYIMLWGQHYFMGTLCFFTILLMYAIERYIRYGYRGGELLLVLSVSAVLIFSYYAGYIIGITAMFYFLIRLLFGRDKSESATDLFRKLFKTVFLVCCGVMISAIVLVPSTYHVMTDSSRLSATTAEKIDTFKRLFFRPFSMDGFKTKLCRFVSNNSLGITGNGNDYFPNYYEAPIYFCTMGIFFFIGQWIVNGFKEAWENKGIIKYLVTLVVAYIIFFNDGVAFFMNAGGGLSFRFTFVLMPILAFMVASVVQKIYEEKRIEPVGNIIAIILSVMTISCMYGEGANDSKAFSHIIVVVIIGFAILFCSINLFKKNIHFVFSLIILLTVASTVLDSCYTTSNRPYVRSENMTLSWNGNQLDNNTQKAMDWIASQDDSFYRIAKDYSDWNEIGDAFVEKYDTVTVYNSTLNSDVEGYYVNIYPGVKMLNPAIRIFQLNTKLDQAASDVVNIKYLLAKNKVDNNWRLLKSFGDVNVYQNKNTDNLAKWYTKTISKEKFEGLSDDEKSVYLKDYVVVDDEFDLESGSAELTQFKRETPTKISGAIKSDAAGVLMIAIPCQEGWKVKVDGKESKLLKCDYGFVGTLVEPGEHSIEVTFSLPYLKEGVCISVIGAIITVIYFLFFRKMATR